MNEWIQSLVRKVVILHEMPNLWLRTIVKSNRSGFNCSMYSRPQTFSPYADVVGMWRRSSNLYLAHAQFQLIWNALVPSPCWKAKWCYVPQAHCMGKNKVHKLDFIWLRNKELAHMDSAILKHPRRVLDVASLGFCSELVRTLRLLPL